MSVESTTNISLQANTSDEAVMKTCEDFPPVNSYVTATQYISMMIIIVEVYLVASFLLFGTLQFAAYCGWRKCSSLLRSTNPPKVQVIILQWCATFCQIAALVRVALTFSASVNEANIPSCNSEAISTRIVFALVLCFMYLFLWFRLYLFYQHKFLKVLFNKCLKFLSWFAFCFLWGGTVVFIYIYATMKSVFIVCGGACQQVESSITTIYIIGCSLSLAFQICVQALFVHPLIAKRHDITLQRPSNQSEVIKNNQTQEPKNGSSRPKPVLEKKSSMSALLKTWRSNQRIMVYVRKCCFLALLCIVTDALSLVVGVIIAKYTPFMFPHLILDIDLLINNLCLLFCFKKWRMVVCPWYYVFYNNSWSGNENRSTMRSTTSSI